MNKFVKKIIKDVLMVVILSLIIIGVIYAVFIFRNNDGQKYPNGITNKDRYCQTDNECELVELRCCPLCSWELVAVHKESALRINDWLKNNCKTCFMRASCEVPEYVHVPYCEKNECHSKDIKRPLQCEDLRKLRNEDPTNYSINRDQFMSQLSSCLFASAFPETAITFCEKSEEKDNCYLGISIGLSNSRYCDKIVESRIRDFCFSTTQKDRP